MGLISYFLTNYDFWISMGCWSALFFLVRGCNESRQMAKERGYYYATFMVKRYGKLTGKMKGPYKIEVRDGKVPLTLSQIIFMLALFGAGVFGLSRVILGYLA